MHPKGRSTTLVDSTTAEPLQAAKVPSSKGMDGLVDAPWSSRNSISGSSSSYITRHSSQLLLAEEGEEEGIESEDSLVDSDGERIDQHDAMSDQASNNDLPQENNSDADVNTDTDANDASLSSEEQMGGEEDMEDTLRA